MWDYFHALVIVALVAMLTRNKSVIATSALLFGNWALNSYICMMTGDAYPYHYFMLVDWATGLGIILIVPLTFEAKPLLWQVLITLLYAMQLGWHVVFMWSLQGDYERYMSWYFLSRTSWAQLVALGVWDGIILYHHICRFVRDISTRSAVD